MGRKPRESTPVTKKFAENLEDLIEEKKRSGLKHEEISAQAGVGSGALSEWASDLKTASIDSLVKLAKYFNVSCDYLLGLSEIRSVVGNEQSAMTLDLPDNFVNYILFIDTNQLTGEKQTLKMVLSDNRFFEAINAITLTRTALFRESPDGNDYDFDQMESLRKQLFELSGGAHSIIHSSLAVKSLLYSAEKIFSEVAEDCVAKFCDIQECDYPLDD